MGWKWFQLVREGENDSSDGNAVSSTSCVFLEIDCEDVDALRKAVKAEYPNKLAQVDAGNLVVFANRTAYDGKKKALAASASIESLGGSLEDARLDDAPIVQVPTVPRIAWTAAPASCPPLIVQANDRFIHLPPSYVDGSGLGHAAAGRRHHG